MAKNVIQNQLIKGIQRDLNDTLVDEQILTHHRNGMFQTQNGDIVFATNEPATLDCVTLPYKYNGMVKLKDNRYLVFSGDGTDSEIGIANTAKCTYLKVVNSPCLNFNNFKTITGFVRINVEGEEEIIFVDGVNPDRVINLSKIPYKYTLEKDTCETKKFTNELDCDELRLNPKVKQPCIKLTKKNQGSLLNGMYSVAFAYSIDGQRFTDYMSLTTPIFINKKSGDSSISVTISNLDRNFDTYQLLLVGTVNGITTNKIVGTYSTSQDSVTITDWINENYQDGIPSSELTVNKILYDNTGLLAANSQYLMRADIKRKPRVNYQPQAFKIETEYYVKQVPLSYYKENGEDIGYFRDENYNFIVQLIWDDGEPTEHYQIAGPMPTDDDLGLATGADVFELTTEEGCGVKDTIKNWEVFNTAGTLERVTNSFSCGERIIGFGKTGYHGSTEVYPDNKEIFGDNACTPIRYHRMPDEAKVPRYSKVNGETYVNILGVKFKGIEKPLDKDGKEIPGIIGYRILRSERDEANKTVISRGLMTNMLGYRDVNDKEIAFTNFPFNSLEPNAYLSKTQTYQKEDVEYDFAPLDKVYDDKFTYYSPYGKYFGRDRLSNYFQIETEEVGTATGYFEKTHDHPKQKLLTNFSYWVAMVLGFLERTLVIVGKASRSTEVQSGEALGTSDHKDSYVTTVDDFNLQSVEDLINFDVIGYTASMIASSVGASSVFANASRLRGILKVLQAAITVVAAIAVKIPYSILSGARLAMQTLKSIEDLSGYRDYAYQYNAVATYDEQIPVLKGDKRRRILRQPFYLDNAIHTVGDLKINNGGRNSNIFVEFEKPLRLPEILDTSRNTVEGYQININDIKKSVSSTSSLFYVTNKQTNPNQYNTIENVKPIKMHNCILSFVKGDFEDTYSTDVLFGGDCIIYLQSHLNKFPLFRQNLSGTNYPPGFAYDYRNYPNVGFPRFWMNTEEFNADLFFTSLKSAIPTYSKLPKQPYNLDGPRTDSNRWLVEDQFMYTSVNGVLNYIVEADYNIAFRDTTQEGEGNNLYQPHYSFEQTDLSYIFRSDLLVKPEYFSLDPSYKFLSQNQVASRQLIELPKADIREKNSISYSLPSFNTQKVNNWIYFLPNNYFSFDERDYGKLTGIHAMDQDRVVFLFSAASPFISMGRDQLETLNGRNVTIGDAGLFAQMPRELMHTDVAYGSNHDKIAFSSTQFGHFYVSRRQGKIFNLSNNLDEISRQGLNKWCAKYMPLFIDKDFPDYPYLDNPSTGVGYLISFDNVYETIYFSKRDYKIKEQFKDKIIYDVESNRFLMQGLEVKLSNPAYFEDASWTLSYHAPSKAFQSWHDWHPDAVIQEERHFITIKDNKLWKHNERTDLYCNYYGKDYPYELEFGVSTGSTVHILQSVQFEQEAYEWRNEGRDRYHNYTETFDKAMIYNTEGFSGVLNLKDATNIHETHRTLPRFNSNLSSDIPYVKVENHFRFNEFRDYTADRGRFTTNKRHIFNIKPNGYERSINPPNIDYNQSYPPRLRHYFNKVWLSKEVCNNIQFITKFATTQLQISSR